MGCKSLTMTYFHTEPTLIIGRKVVSLSLFGMGRSGTNLLWSSGITWCWAVFVNSLANS